MDESELFLSLGPNQILSVLEASGLEPDGHITALNSYENRVYRIGLYDTEPVVVKFYRPKRWSDAAILEEHQFTLQLHQQELPVIAPVEFEPGQTLHHYEQYRFAMYPCVGGRPPELDNSEHLTMIGRFLAQIHLLGELKSFEHRPVIDLDAFVKQPAQYLLEHNYLPIELQHTYETIIDDLIGRLQRCIDSAGNVQQLRLHGDAHPGNILWYDDKPLILDFDDARSGPAVQDIWMFLSGDRPYMSARLHDLMIGYSEFRHFDPAEFALIETLRTFRQVYFSAWLAKRWNDPAFPQAFPYFNGQRYWEEHILSLREQSALLEEPPLEWLP